ncbi:uncharacterized protein DS421_9g260680 [Arachis hypogaea]|nr:uncharacterized protein DS421_9g260680 [Arachis hypogaea]
MAGRNQAGKNQTKDLKCATHLLSEKFRNMSEEKKTIVRDLGFGGLMHIPPLRVNHQILRELANSFKLGEIRLETGYGSFKVRPKTIGAALGINASGDLFPQKDRLMFKRIFILYIQMVFVLPTTINKISPVHMASIFKMDTIIERNWRAHVLNFIIKGITDYNLKKKKAIDSCLFALMIIYFHLSKNKDKKMAERPPKLWIANWTKEQLVERIRAEMEDHMIRDCKDGRHKGKNERNKEKREETKKTKKGRQVQHHHLRLKQLKVTILPLSLRLKTQRIQQENNPPEKPKKCLLLTYRSEESSPVEKQKTKKKTQRTPKKTQSKKKKVVVEDSSPEQAQSYHGYSTLEKEADLRSTEGHYVSSEIIPDINLGSDDPSSQGHTEQSSVNKPAESVLSLVEELASEPAEENMMVVREETPSEGLAIVPIQVCLLQSQTTTMSEIEQTPETENEPTPLLKIEGTTKSNPAPKDATALMMIARTSSYVPKTDPLPSFSLGLTDSSQEEAATQEGASMQDEGRAKTPEIPKLLEQLGDLVHKIASGGVTTKEKSPQIPKESGTESFE